MTIFDYKDDESLGTVISVDTTTVTIEIKDSESLRRLQVNRLMALQSSKPGQHLVGLISQVTRKKIASDDTTLEDSDVNELNLCKVSLIGSLLDRDGLQKNIFRRTIESVPEIDANCFPIEGDYLTNFMRVISQAVGDGASLTLGNYTLDEKAIAYLNGNKFFQRHAFIGGSTGSGKSWTTAKIIEQVANLDNCNAILFDLHGEYKPLTDVGIRHYKIAGPTDIEMGKGVDDGVIFLPYWLLTYEAIVSFFIDRSDMNAPNQAMVVSREINSEKKKYLTDKGLVDILANYTIDSPIPFSINNLVDTLNDLNTEMVPGQRGEKQGEFYSKFSRMIARLENKRSDRRLGFMFQGGAETEEFEWLNKLSKLILGGNNENGGGGVKIIDFSEVPSDILPLIVSLVARLAFSIQQWTPSSLRHPVALLCDEAHLYIPNKNNSATADDISIDIFERIAKEGRKYGVSLVVISQRPSEVNKTILSQCSNYISMRLTNADDQAVIKRLLPDNLGGFSELLPTLDTGEALVVGDASLIPSRIRIAEPKQKPNSGTVDFWTKWQEPSQAKRIDSAIENWRKQNIS
ncbi:ATP-binding protein [Serratia liquefaciens]|uniref:ATP-binding protein n=1 Tax=Serratia liquefaciens TaxID=614 RepID=UPI0018D7EF96|nr:ATP-binding protein [Serratia liquefaciens]MBH2812364.1 ATP-binding protein [Serratia liquefaciens]